jgi:hypothetical protein
LAAIENTEECLFRERSLERFCVLCLAEVNALACWFEVFRVDFAWARVAVYFDEVHVKDFGDNARFACVASSDFEAYGAWSECCAFAFVWSEEFFCSLTHDNAHCGA